jgi:hypothetical protein
MTSFLKSLGLFFLAAVLADTFAGTGATDALATMLTNATQAVGAELWDHVISEILAVAPQIVALGG